MEGRGREMQGIRGDRKRVGERMQGEREARRERKREGGEDGEGGKREREYGVEKREGGIEGGGREGYI